MQWIEGVRLTQLPPEEIQQLVKVGQEAFLVQLLEVRTCMWGPRSTAAFISVCAGAMRGMVGPCDAPTKRRTQIAPHSPSDRFLSRRPSPRQGRKQMQT